MKNKQNNNDIFLRNLLKKTDLDKAPSGFTDKVMNRIAVEASNEQVTEQPFLSKKHWIMLVAGFAALVALVFFVDWSFLGLNLQPSEVDEQQFKSFLSFYQNLLGTMKSAFSFFTNSTIPVIVLAGVASLVLLDKLLRRIDPNRSFLF